MRFMEKFRVVLFLILGMMALALLTWGIGKIYLELVGQAGNEQTIGVMAPQQPDSTQPDTVLVLPEVRFWTCQLGIFQNERNAQSMREQLRVMGIQAEVISSQPWVVSIGLGRSASDLKELRQHLKEQDISTVPKQIQLSERSFRVAGNGAQLTAELLTNVNTILREGLTQESLAKEEQLWTALAGEHSPKDLEGLHQYYRQLRSRTTLEEQKAVGLSLFFESQRIINKFSGK